jgi:TonB family protein
MGIAPIRNMMPLSQIQTDAVVTTAITLKKQASGLALRSVLTLLLLALAYQPLGASVIQPLRLDSPGIAPDSAPALLRASVHYAEFSPIAPALALPACADVRPAEALLTPDPRFPAEVTGALVRVSFIIGSDGHVHSAFVLASAGSDADAAVLRTVKAWRYRPATCNGVPTDSEARVRFSLHQ